MEEIERITKVKNSVGSAFSFGINPKFVFQTNEGYVYRTTGMDQVEDIVNTGYVRHKGYGARLESRGPIIYWFSGGGKISYSDQGAILEAPADKVMDGQIGAIHINDLTGIWLYNKDEEQFQNCIDYYKDLYNQLHQEEIADKSR